MKKSKEPEEFVTLMFGENFQEIFKNQKVRLIIHNENDVRSKKPRNNMSVEERHLVNELKQMHSAKNFETLVGCEVLYGMDFVFADTSKEDADTCVLQVPLNGFFLYFTRPLPNMCPYKTQFANASFAYFRSCEQQNL